MRAISRDKSGASAVEFALIAPFLLLLVVAILAYGSIFATSLSLQQMAAETARATIGGLNDSERQNLAQAKLSAISDKFPMLDAAKVTLSFDAGAEVEIDDIKCKADGSAEVVLKARTEAASVGLKASLLPRIPVKLGNDESKKLTFTKADIDAQTYKPVRSGLGLQLGGLSVAQKLLFNPVDSLLEKLGLHVAEADVKVTEATCGSVGLIH